MGSPYWMSPEMVSFNAAGPFTDLWSLGIVAFELLTGHLPFKGSNRDTIFAKIRDRDFSYPEDMDVDARDLIDQLLQMNPLDRLGYGEIGSGRDYAGLKAHPFFKNIDFDKMKNDDHF